MIIVLCRRVASLLLLPCSAHVLPPFCFSRALRRAASVLLLPSSTDVLPHSCFCRSLRTCCLPSASPVHCKRVASLLLFPCSVDVLPLFCFSRTPQTCSHPLLCRRLLLPCTADVLPLLCFSRALQTCCLTSASPVLCRRVVVVRVLPASPSGPPMARPCPGHGPAMARAMAGPSLNQANAIRVLCWDIFLLDLLLFQNWINAFSKIGLKL